MGYDLYNNNGDYFHFNIWTWRPVLKLATKYGWEPMGTEKARDTSPYGGWDEEKSGKWGGRYCSNSWQVVVEEDAKALAQALEIALSDQQNWQNKLDEEYVKIIGSLYPSGEQVIRDFIVFCRKGEFEIW